jgi:hypothetical protein
VSKAPFEPLSYRDALDQLRVAHGRGLLVPFVGSGLCVPRLRLWPKLVKALACEANMDDLVLGSSPTDQELIVASERIVWRLRAAGRALAEVVENALPNPDSSENEVPPGVDALASVWWPLVLTTNYDRLFVNAFNKAHPHSKDDTDTMVVAGRNPADCHTVMASLNLPMRPLLWALQGFLGEGVNGEDLTREIVLGYDQYRRATFGDVGFRAAFSEVYRNRSLLFVGAGLGEEYFRGLFGESLFRLGPNQHTHCALVNAKDLDRMPPWFMHTRLNIVVLTYEDERDAPKYSGFVPCIQEIAAVLSAPPRGQRRFWIGQPPAVCVDIEPTPLPEVSTAKHWIVGSAGVRHSGAPRISGDMPKQFGTKWTPLPDAPDLMKCRRKWALLAVARAGGPQIGHRSRDLRKVADVTERALQVAVRGGASTVSFMLLGASVHARRWPRVFSLVQMLRGIRRFVQHRDQTSRKPYRALRVLIHDTAAARRAEAEPDRSVWHAIETGRLDPNEVLNAGALRIFVEIELDDPVARTPMYVDEDKTVGHVAEYFQVPKGWCASLEPNPAPRQTHDLTAFGVSLSSAGIVPGSVLRFRPTRRHTRAALGPSPGKLAPRSARRP